MLNENMLKGYPWNKKMKILRSIEDISQTEFAIKCNTTQKVYHLWETGKSYPRKNSMIAIARAFEVSVEEIFGDDDEKI